ncbi:MAG: PD-(D/E)XK nuclease family protein, partial [Actinomycetota bacterium]|nr:PD-(D/E)XK nuclease family protein [Actinomycetota bacterium]
MSVRTIATPYGVSALNTVREVVRDAKIGDAMAPVTLLLPNDLAGIVARRHLAGGLTDGGNGVAALSLATLPRLAEQLAAPLLAPRKPATEPIVAAAWRSVLDQTPSVFDAVKDHPATIRALVAAHRELRDLSAEGLEHTAAASRLAHDLVRLHRQVTATLADSWYDT